MNKYQYLTQMFSKYCTDAILMFKSSLFLNLHRIIFVFSKKYQKASKLTDINLIISEMKKIVIAVFLAAVATIIDCNISPDTVCNFHIVDKIFSLVPIQRSDPYESIVNQIQNSTIQWSFCKTFIPKQCANDPNIKDAFSFLVTRQLNQEDKPQIQDIIQPYQPQQQEEDTQYMLENAQQNQVQQSYSPKTQVQNTNSQQKHALNLIADTHQNHLIAAEDINKYRYVCTAYSSNYLTSYFSKKYEKQNNRNYLQLNLTNGLSKASNQYKQTIFTIQCDSKSEGFNLTIGSLGQYNQMIIIGRSKSGCPIFSISSIWTVLQQNIFLFGIIIFILGLNSLFFGRAMLVVTIFVAGYFITFVILAAISSLFLKPTTSSIIVYFSLLFVLFLCTVVAYGCTKLIKFSIFLIGAWLGFIVGALVNSIFSKMFDIYSVWSLVIIDLLCMLPLGLLTFKYADIVVILSTSITGAYMVVRPISWIFGGYPNELLLQELYQSGHLDSLPWTFFLYLVLIIALAILGGLYQFLKLRRQDPNQQIEVNFVEAHVEQSVDKVKQVVDTFIERFKSDTQSEQYKKMRELEQKKHKSDQDQF